MGLVQFREDDAVLNFLRAQGLNPNQLSRELLEARVRRLRSQARMRALEAMSADLGDVVTLVRDEREDRR